MVTHGNDWETHGNDLVTHSMDFIMRYADSFSHGINLIIDVDDLVTHVTTIVMNRKHMVMTW
jgi:hypothetical protein